MEYLFWCLSRALVQSRGWGQKHLSVLAEREAKCAGFALAFYTTRAVWSTPTLSCGYRIVVLFADSSVALVVCMPELAENLFDDFTMYIG